VLQNKLQFNRGSGDNSSNMNDINSKQI